MLTLILSSVFTFICGNVCSSKGKRPTCCVVASFSWSIGCYKSKKIDWNFGTMLVIELFFNCLALCMHSSNWAIPLHKMKLSDWIKQAYHSTRQYRLAVSIGIPKVDNKMMHEFWRLEAIMLLNKGNLIPSWKPRFNLIVAKNRHGTAVIRAVVTIHLRIQLSLHISQHWILNRNQHFKLYS